MRDRFENFASIVLELNRCVQKIKDIELKEFNLKGTQGMCLYYLAKNPKGLTSAELTNLIKEDKAAISRAIKYLTEIELVYMENDDASEKRSYRNPLFLTEKGLELAVSINKKIDDVLSMSDYGVTNKERLVMYTSLKQITQNLSKYIDECDEK